MSAFLLRHPLSVITLLTLLAGCPASGQRSSEAQERVADGNQGALRGREDVTTHDRPKETAKAAPKAAPMDPQFEKARNAFLAYAAGELNVEPGAIDLTPRDAEVPPGDDSRRIGSLWRFDAISGDRPDERLRGWATAHGAVVTLEHNIRLLLDQMELWSSQSNLDADAIAAHLAWTLVGHKLLPGAKLEMDHHHKGRLIFMTEYAELPRGGAPGPSQYFEYTLTLGKQP